MLPIISTKKPTDGVRRPSPLLESKKPMKRPRPRAVLPPAASSKSKANNMATTNSSTNNHAGKRTVTENDKGIARQDEDWQQKCHDDDDDDNDEHALILAAEAAAALIMGSDAVATVAAAAPTMPSTTSQNGTNSDGALTNRTSLELLENVVASVKVVQDDNGIATAGIAWGETNHSDNYHQYQNPLGPSSQVQIFESKVPTMMLASSSLLEMSETHREFLAQYYGGGGADQYAHDFLRNNEDEDEEIIEEDADDFVVGGGMNNNINNNNNNNNNSNNKKMSAEVTESLLEGAMATTTTTLRALCKKIPRSTSTKKRKKSNEVSFHEGDNVIHSLTKDEVEGNVVDGETSTTASTSLNAEDHPLTGPQVTVDEHGTIVIAQDSLLPNPENRQSTTDIDNELLGGGSVVDEGETPSQLGAIQARYDSYMAVPRTVPVRWSVSETKDFYNALRQCGTDFSLMQMYCLGRTRAQLKRKFKVESRKNARLVDMALDPKCHVKLDISVFGDSLEIPEEVREVTPTLPAVGGAAASADSGVAAVSNNLHEMERNYDHLFEEEDGDLPVGENYAASAADDTGVAMDSATLTSVDNNASKSNSDRGGDALHQPLTILPIVAQMVAKKKTRFKVKPSKKPSGK